MNQKLTTNKPWAQMIVQIATSISGTSPEVLFNAAGIDLEQWRICERVNQEDLTALWEVTERLSRRPDIGLDVLTYFNFQTIGPLAVKMMSATTLRQAISEAFHQIAVISEVWQYTLSDHQGSAILSFRLANPKVTITHHSYDAFVSACVRMIRDCFPTDICKVTEIHFSHGDFGLKQQYESRLGVPCYFNKAGHEIHLDASLLDLPLPSANAFLYESLGYQLDRQAKERQGIVSEIEMIILELIQAGKSISRKTVSERLGMGERTMLRRLNKASRTYKDIEESVFSQYAHQSLLRGEPMDVIAEQLRYADASSLAKMLKRKTGRGIRELRHQPL